MTKNSELLIQQTDRLSPVFIVGNPQSGARLLFLLFEEHSSILSLFETGLFDLDINKHDEESELRTKFHHFLTCTLSAPQRLALHWDANRIVDLALELHRRSPITNMHRICMRAMLASELDALPPIRRQGITHFIEKMPRHCSGIENLFHAYPEARVVHVLRDPRDSYLALKRRMSLRDQTDRECAPMTVLHDHILSSLSAAKANSEWYPFQYKIIFYEDVVKDLEHLGESLCDWMDLPWEESLLYPSHNEQSFEDNSGHPFDSQPVDRWKTELSTRELFLLEAIIHAHGLEKKYPVRSRHFGKWLAGLCALWKPFEKELLLHKVKQLPRQIGDYFQRRFSLLATLLIRSPFPFKNVLHTKKQARSTTKQAQRAAFYQH